MSPGSSSASPAPPSARDDTPSASPTPSARASLAPGFGMARHQIGKCKLAAGDVEGAVPALREAARVEPDIPAHHLDLAEALVQYGTPGAAIAALEEGLAALEGAAAVEAALARTKKAWGVGGDSKDL